MGRRGPSARESVAVGVEGIKLRCPKHLTPAAAAVWKRYVPPMARMGLLVDVDEMILTTFCLYAAKWTEYMAELENLDPATQEHRRVSQTANDACNRLTRALGELGLSPNARARLRLESSEVTQNELDEFLVKKR